MKKSEALKKLIYSAKIYDELLLNKNYIFITEKDNKYLEVLFQATNFKHLTGIETDLKPKRFFESSLSGKIKEADINFKKNGTTELKLNILPSILNIQNISKMIGEFDNNGLLKVRLYSEKIIGNTNYCMGLVQDKSGYYSPNTVLKEDLRKISISTQKVIFVFKKNRADKLYNEICYVAKGLDIKEIDFKKEILSKLDGKLLAEIKPLEKNQILENKKP